VATDRLQILIEAQDRASAAIGALQGRILGLVGAYLSFQGAQRVFQFAVDQIGQAIEAASQQEQADVKLANAVATLGGNTARLTAHLKDQASALQLTTTFTDDSIQAAQALLVSLGRLSGEGLDRATKAAVALAQGLGVDLESAATLLAKAAAGSTVTLARYGIVLDDTLSKSEKFEAVLKFVEGRFGSLAEAMGGSFQGRLTQAKNQFGELQEAIGNSIIHSPEVLAGLKSIADSFKEMTDAVAGADFDDKVGRAAIALARLAQIAFHFAAALSFLGGIDPIPGLAESFAELEKLAAEANRSMIDAGAAAASLRERLAWLHTIPQTTEVVKAIKELEARLGGAAAAAQNAGAMIETVGEDTEAIKKLREQIEGTELQFRSLSPAVTTSADDAIALQLQIARLRTEIELAGVSTGPLVEKLDELDAALETVLTNNDAIEGMALSFTSLGPVVTTSADDAIALQLQIARLRTEIELAGVSTGPLIDKLNELNIALTEATTTTAAEQWDALSEKQQLYASGVADLGGQLVQMGIQGQLTFENLAAAVRNFVAQLIAAIVRMLILQAIARAFGAAVGGSAGAAAGGAIAGGIGSTVPGFGPSLTGPPNTGGLGTLGPSSATVSINQGFLGVSDAFVRDLNEAQSRVARSYGVSIVPLGSLT